MMGEDDGRGGEDEGAGGQRLLRSWLAASWLAAIFLLFSFVYPLRGGGGV